MSRTNNVIRFLNSKGVAYTVFETKNEKLGALETAQFLNIEADQVFKSIVISRGKDAKPLLVIIPGSSKVDLKKVATAADIKKVIMPTEREAEELTGLQAGGISPLALLNKGFEFFLDETAFVFDRIHISGGERGLNIALHPQTLQELIRAKIGDFLGE